MYDDRQGTNRVPVYLFSVLTLIALALLLVYPLGMAAVSAVLVPVGFVLSQADEAARKGYGVALATVGLLGMVGLLCTALAALSTGRSL